MTSSVETPSLDPSLPFYEEVANEGVEGGTVNGRKKKKKGHSPLETIVHIEIHYYTVIFPVPSL